MQPHLLRDCFSYSCGQKVVSAVSALCVSTTGVLPAVCVSVCLCVQPGHSAACVYACVDACVCLCVSVCMLTDVCVRTSVLERGCFYLSAKCGETVSSYEGLPFVLLWGSHSHSALKSQKPQSDVQISVICS